MKTRFAIFVMALSVCCHADAKRDEKSRVAHQERRLKMTGGKIEVPNSQKGKIVFVNTQDKYETKDIAQVATELCELTKLNVQCQVASKAAPVELKKKFSADLVIVIEDSKDAPSILIAPEDGWGMVNVAKVDVGLKSEDAKKKFFASRVKKELYRVYSLLCGGGSSQFEGNVLNCARQQDIDLYEAFLPADLVERHARYLKQLGFSPKKIVSYRKACVDGWAPAPTNDYQKAIWEKVHSLPTEPIKILPESQRGSRK